MNISNYLVRVMRRTGDALDCDELDDFERASVARRSRVLGDLGVLGDGLETSGVVLKSIIQVG